MPVTYPVLINNPLTIVTTMITLIINDKNFVHKGIEDYFYDGTKKA